MDFRTICGVRLPDELEIECMNLNCLFYNIMLYEINPINNNSYYRSNLCFSMHKSI